VITLEDFMTYQHVVIANPPDGDLGDAPQRTAMYYIGKFLRGEADDFTRRFFKYARDILQPSGQLIRDPTGKDRGGVLGNDPNDISRDQQDPWLIALCLYGYPYSCRQIIFDRWKNFGRYPNGDIMSPETLAMDLRVLGYRISWPLIFILDLWTVLGSVIDCVNAAWPSHKMQDGPWLDKDNSVTRLAFYRVRLPTPLSTLAQYILREFFPDNIGGPGIYGAIVNKHRAGVGNEPMAWLWRPLI
jgi:hypothetical protein